MLIRDAHERDAPAIARLARELAHHVADPDPGAETGELIELGFGDRRWFECLVADAGPAVVGFAAYSKRFELHTRSRMLWLGDLVVTQRWRGKGVGELLVRALRCRAAELGCDGIVLELWTGNARARSFYRKAGAMPVEMLEVLHIRVCGDPRLASEDRPRRPRRPRS